MKRQIITDPPISDEEHGRLLAHGYRHMGGTTSLGNPDGQPRLRYRAPDGHDHLLTRAEWRARLAELGPTPLESLHTAVAALEAAEQACDTTGAHRETVIEAARRFVKGTRP